MSLGAFIASKLPDGILEKKPLVKKILEKEGLKDNVRKILVGALVGVTTAILVQEVKR